MLFLLHVLACECQSSMVITPVLPVVLQPVPDLNPPSIDSYQVGSDP